MPSFPTYKVIFYNQGQIFEIFARQIYQSDLYGFIEIEELVFGERSGMLVDPSEEKLNNLGPARVVPMPSLGREAGVGVNRKAKRKHNPGIPNASRIKRRMTETDRLEAIASINRMRVARASNDPG